MQNNFHDHLPKKIPSLNAIANELSVIMPRFIRCMYPYMYESIDVPPAQVFVLLTVSEKTTCNLSDIGQELNITAPTASGLVARLVKKGYLKRGQNAADRRKLDISLTNSGRKVIGKFQQNVLKMWRKNLKKFSPIERMGPLYFIKQILKDIEP